MKNKKQLQDYANRQVESGSGHKTSIATNSQLKSLLDSLDEKEAFIEILSKGFEVMREVVIQQGEKWKTLQNY